MKHVLEKDSSGSNPRVVEVARTDFNGDGVKMWRVGRRQGFRSQHFRGKELQIDYRGKVLAAKIIDTSDDGLGVELDRTLADRFVRFVRRLWLTRARKSRRTADAATVYFVLD